jgi:hypothetical protein
MNRGLKCIIWLIGGPIASLISGWFVFWFFGFVIGGGIDIDSLNPPWQRTISTLSLPAGGLLFAVGTFFSLFMGLASLRNPEDADA